MEIRKNELNKILSEQRKEYQRYNKILLEDFDSKFKLLAEKFDRHDEKFDALFKMVAQNTESLELIKIDINFIKQELKQKVNQDEFVALEKRVILLEKKLKRA